MLSLPREPFPRLAVAVVDVVSVCEHAVVRDHDCTSFLALQSGHHRPDHRSSIGPTRQGPVAGAAEYHYSETHTTVLGPAWLTRHDLPHERSVISAGSGALTWPPRHPLSSETRKARHRLAALRRLE